MPNTYVNKVELADGTSLIDISDTTAAASDVASGKYFYLATGERVQGSGSGGGSAQTATGTVTGGGTTTLQISSTFAPDVIYVHGNLSTASLRGVMSITIIKDTVLYMTSDGSQSAVQENLYTAQHGITGYNESQTAEPHATYASNVLTIDTANNTTQARFTNGVTYSYTLIKYA